MCVMAECPRGRQSEVVIDSGTYWTLVLLTNIRTVSFDASAAAKLNLRLRTGCLTPCDGTREGVGVGGR